MLDFKKLIDTVNRDMFTAVVAKIDSLPIYLALIRAFHSTNTAVRKRCDELSYEFSISMGDKQDYVIPILFFTVFLLVIVILSSDSHKPACFRLGYRYFDKVL